LALRIWGESGEGTTTVVGYGEGIRSVNGIGKTFDIRERTVKTILKKKVTVQINPENLQKR